MTGNTRFAAAKANAPSALRLRHDELLNDILQLHFPSASSAGIALTVENGTKKVMDLATKRAVKEKRLHRAIGSHVSNKSRDSKDRYFGISGCMKSFRVAFFIHLTCDVFALLTDCLNVVAFYLCSWE